MSENVKDLLHAAEAEFANRWGRKPTTAVFAPGRVNIIGEHTYYNDGFVMPMVRWFLTLKRVSCYKFT